MWPWKWQPALHGRKCSSWLLPKNRADVYVVTAELAKAVCDGRTVVVLFSPRFVRIQLPSFIYGGDLLPRHREGLSFFSFPSSSCLSLQDDRSGTHTTCHLGKTRYGTPFVNVSDPNVIPPFLPPRSVIILSATVPVSKAVVIDNHVSRTKQGKGQTYCYGREMPTGGKATPT